MNRLILVPQYPTHLRYQEWWWHEFPARFKKYFDQVVTLGVDPFEQKREFKFVNLAPITPAIMFEASQIEQYMAIEHHPGDILLLNDLSFPGLFSNVLFHKSPVRCFAICHATSKNKYDYFSADREYKWQIEKATSKLFDKVFVASEYHKDKLGWKNIEVLPFPDAPLDGIKAKYKKYDVVSVSRPVVQKRNFKFEKQIEKALITNIISPINSTWEGYYNFLAEAKVLLITSKEETYGYQVVDAIKNHCVPIAPNGFSYPELLPKEYLYSNLDECVQKIRQALYKGLPVPKLKTEEEAGKFYEKISNIMKYE